MQLSRTQSHDTSVYYFGVALLVAVAGFYPSFFSQPTRVGTLRLVHGTLATTWLLLLIVQATLARTRRLAPHRILGWSSLAIVPPFLVSGVLLVCDALAGTNPFQRAYATRLAWVDFLGLAFFACCYGLALWHRRRRPLHLRYMACTAVLVLPPATARALGAYLPGVSSFDTVFHAGMLISVVVALVLMVRDMRAGRLLPPYPLLLAVLLAQQVGFVAIAGSTTWAALCRHLAG